MGGGAYEPTDAIQWHSKGYTHAQAHYLFEMIETAAPKDHSEADLIKTWLELLASPAPAFWVMRYVENGYFTASTHVHLEERRIKLGKSGIGEFLDAIAIPATTTDRDLQVAGCGGVDDGGAVP